MKTLNQDQSNRLDALLIQPSADLIELMRELYCAEQPTEVEAAALRVQLHLARFINQDRRA
ncbi:hypothetical protein [Vibrio injensis]|uniref:hypothetical protein n=1 Tax=Vibrio injensis TaxID=1307414 RepID=UPI0009350985|nr:hypothetical protein [Vibrio injensis]